MINITAEQFEQGLPYPTKPETTVSPDYKRGTLKQLYEQIDADIEAALPDVSDDIYTQPKYHFNQKAAYAFAARFNLYYMNYDKVITYASKVLGANPTSLLRNYVPFMSLSNSEDIENRYISSSENANLLLMTAGSKIGRNISGSEARFCHNQNVGKYETIWAKTFLRRRGLRKIRFCTNHSTASSSSCNIRERSR